MTPLIILITTFGILWALNRFALNHKLSLSQLGCISLAGMLVATALAHFFKTGEMVQMMPSLVPYKTEIVYATGVFEIVAAALLINRRTARVTSVLLILFFLAVLPANVIGSLKQVPLGGMEYGPEYLYFRIPFQLLLIWWTYYFGIRLMNR